MEVTINGKRNQIPGSIDLEGFLLSRGIKKEGVAVELNKKIIKRIDYSGVVLHENDSLEIVQIVGGG